MGDETAFIVDGRMEFNIRGDGIKLYMYEYIG
jgi:hypothetical protein